jgi:deoxyribodipyrimidine photo-lyase
MTDIVLFWHRRDLRITDNLGLAAAVQSGNQVVGVFCWDPAIFNRSSMAPASASYALESLQLLQQEYAAAGSILLILTGDTVQILQDLSQKLAATAIYCNRSVEPAQRALGKKLTAALRIPIYPHWDGLLHAPDTIYSGSNTPYSVYTPYWRNWQDRPKPEPVIVQLPALGSSQRQTVAKLEQTLPALGDLAWPRPQILAPGSGAARSRLELFASKAIESYGEDRNFPALDGTSTLSPALAWGTLGIRTTWQATIQAMESCRGLEAQASVTVWRQELAWREFYWQALYHFPELAAGPYRKLWQDFPWSDDRARFELWCQGQTGYPIVDAAMRQLHATGWMHNRCRMVVASFLTKDLIVNWQWGEQYFMQTLVDGDLAANNGGWQWSASSGMDPKPLRIFNPYTQAQKFDQEGDYLRQWLPELKSVGLKELLTGQIPPLWRAKSGYPAPIVDHNTQQKEFKRRYAQLKDDRLEA